MRTLVKVRLSWPDVTTTWSTIPFSVLRKGVDVSIFVLFPHDRSGREDIRSPGRAELAQIAEHMKSLPANTLITVMGHADITGGAQYNQALSIASKTADKETQLASKVNLAKTDLALGHAAAVIPQLKKLAHDADALGLKALSVECSVALAQALVATKNTAAAEQTLVLTQARAENLGLRVLDAKAQALQAALATSAGKSSEAAIQNRAVVRILEAISKEDGAAKVLERADLKAIYAAAK